MLNLAKNRGRTIIIVAFNYSSITVIKFLGYHYQAKSCYYTASSWIKLPNWTHITSMQRCSIIHKKSIPRTIQEILTIHAHPATQSHGKGRNCTITQVNYYAIKHAACKLKSWNILNTVSWSRSNPLTLYRIEARMWKWTGSHFSVHSVDMSTRETIWLICETAYFSVHINKLNTG